MNQSILVMVMLVAVAAYVITSLVRDEWNPLEWFGSDSDESDSDSDESDSDSDESDSDSSDAVVTTVTLKPDGALAPVAPSSVETFIDASADWDSREWKAVPLENRPTVDMSGILKCKLPYSLQSYCELEKPFSMFYDEDVVSQWLTSDTLSPNDIVSVKTAEEMVHVQSPRSLQAFWNFIRSADVSHIDPDIASQNREAQVFLNSTVDWTSNPITITVPDPDIGPVTVVPGISYPWSMFVMFLAFKRKVDPSFVIPEFVLDSDGSEIQFRSQGELMRAFLSRVEPDYEPMPEVQES